MLSVIARDRFENNQQGEQCRTDVQVVSGFIQDENTTNLCFQVLKVALASLAGERP